MKVSQLRQPVNYYLKNVDFKMFAQVNEYVIVKYIEPVVVLYFYFYVWLK